MRRLARILSGAAVLLVLTLVGCQAAPADPPADPPATLDPAAPSAREPGMAGMITEPLHALRDFKKSSIFTLQIEPAVKLFHATEGRYPRDMDEFETAILKPAQIKLPESPEGYEYHYDAETGELSLHAVES